VRRGRGTPFRGAGTGDKGGRARRGRGRLGLQHGWGRRGGPARGPGAIGRAAQARMEGRAAAGARARRARHSWARRRARARERRPRPRKAAASRPARRLVARLHGGDEPVEPQVLDIGLRLVLRARHHQRDAALVRLLQKGRGLPMSGAAPASGPQLRAASTVPWPRPPPHSLLPPPQCLPPPKIQGPPPASPRPRRPPSCPPPP
jgi:hypothetical protein